MKTYIHKILSVVLAVLVFMSTTSFIMDTHFCGDSLVDWSLIQHAEGCGMETPLPQDNNCNSQISKTSCCTDLQIVNQGQDQIQPTASNLSLDLQVFVVSFVYTYYNALEGLDIYVVPFKDYIPPLLTPDLQKLQETYII